MTTDYEDIFDNPDEDQVERQWRILQAIRRSSGVTKQELVWERKVSGPVGEVRFARES